MLQQIFIIALYATAISAFIGGFAAFGGLAERKIIGRIHSRYGPTMTGPYGLLQTVADALKFIAKKPLIPRLADRALFIVIPILMVALPFTIFVVLPWGNTPVWSFKYDLLFIISLLAINPILILLGAWAGNSKYATLGGLRAVSQILAYEGVLFVSLLPLVYVSGSFSIVDIVKYQQAHTWLLVLQPISFFLFLVALVAISERQPFDLPEAESELVQGWMTEYGGVFFAMILLAQYVTLWVGAVSLAALFFGGWGDMFGVPGFIIKIILGVLIFIYFRATYFRLRIDQLLAFTWKWLIPIGILNLLLVVFIF
ncbi:MAG: NADH-quinone oxidoreductase subunit H [bacterium]|nr:NADH-quinone oxidoreductase subunit H [bacterium]